MNFIIDAHLPASLASCFQDHDVIHTTRLSNGNFTADGEINSLSVLQKRILITKDSDFYYSYISSKKPYKLILVKLGNMRLSELKEYFYRNAEKIIQLMTVHSFIILESTRIRVLE